jgi:hypothetical protein
VYGLRLYVVKTSGTTRAFLIERVSAPLCG